MRYRMYSFVLRQLSSIQKGIQSAHAVVEYANAHGKNDDSDYDVWSKVDKTLIILDGGTISDMKEIEQTLKNIGVDYATFQEEDLGGLITAITVLADERVWNFDEYPSYDPAPKPKGTDIGNGIYVTPSIAIIPKPYEEWVEQMGGESIVRLRNLIGSKRLAH